MKFKAIPKWFKKVVRRIRNWRKPSGSMEITLQQWGKAPIVRKLRRLGTKNRRSTTVVQVLDQINKYHGSKDMGHISVLVNGVVATPTTIVPQGAVVSIVHRIKAGRRRSADGS